MTQNCKYKGGGLGKSTHGTPSFLVNIGSQQDKKGLGSNWDTKKSLGPIKFILECTMIELCDDIDENLWIDDTIPLEFDYFSIDDGYNMHLNYPWTHCYPLPFYPMASTNPFWLDHVK